MMGFYVLETILIFTAIVSGLRNTRRSCDHCFSDCLASDSCDNYGCKPGYRGTNCSLHCSINCRDGISSKPVCDQNTGRCLSGCREGFHGTICDAKCSSQCLNTICNMEDGICTQGCIEHRHGPRCASQCNETCVNRTCDRNGMCTSCINGYFGIFCENPCSPNCAGDTCTMTYDGTSKCSSGCVSGWKGLNCDMPHTVEHLDHSPDDHSQFRRSPKDTFTAQCQNPCQNCLTKKDNGKCHIFCKPGFYGLGDSCSHTCSDTCFKENNIPVCDNTGICSNCQIGHWGDKCKDECSSMCFNGTCTPKKGLCLWCENTSGAYCEEKCSDLCLHHLCDRWNRSCTDGCSPGRYGVNCNYTCSENCEDSECILSNQGNPICKGGCKDTYKGSYCGERCPVDCLRCRQLDGLCTACKDDFEGENCTLKASSWNVKMYILIPILVLVVIIGVTVLIVCLKKKGLICKHDGIESSQNRDNDDQELQMSSVMDGKGKQKSGDLTSDMKNENEEETKHLLENPPPDESAAKEELKVEPRPELMDENADGNHLHQAGQGITKTFADTQIGSQPTRCRNGMTQEGSYLGLPDDDLKELKQTLAEFNQYETDKHHMNNLMVHLGYSEENIPPLSEDAFCTMLKGSPNLQGLETNHAIYKFILALRFAGIDPLAEKLTNKHEDCLPRQFMDGVRKVDKLRQKDAENTENNNVYQVCKSHPKLLHKHNGRTISEVE